MTSVQSSLALDAGLKQCWTTLFASAFIGVIYVSKTSHPLHYAVNPEALQVSHLLLNNPMTTCISDRTHLRCHVLASLSHSGAGFKLCKNV